MKTLRLLVVVALTMGGLHLHAQHLGVEYTAELQTDFKACNFVNLLRLGGDIPLCRWLSVEMATITVAKTREERLIDDFQTFSNIEEDNLTLALAVCGVSLQLAPEHTLFLGVRNMNEDYFVSPITSFFTNSSCGIYPTVSANYPIANYPMASLGLHYHYASERFDVMATLYNGVGRNRFVGSESVFRPMPKQDGVFGLAQVGFQHEGSSYFVGGAVRWCGGIGGSPWVYLEQRLTDRLSLLVGCSHAFTAEAECRDFAGLGLHYQWDRAEVGVFFDYARFAQAHEWATELTCRIDLCEHISLQPVVHAIVTSSRLSSVCSLRLLMSFRKFGWKSAER